MVEDYELMDSGDGRKYERFGDVSLVRPCSQALWRPESPETWSRATATFDREDGNRWHNRGALPKEWTIETAGIRFRLSGTDFGHLGIFPEQRAQWNWIREIVKWKSGRVEEWKSGKVEEGKGGKVEDFSSTGNSKLETLNSKLPTVLNLFAYSGGSTIAAAQGGAEVCHLDASKGMVQWARANAELNGLKEHPIRWITDDAHKFMEREIRRGRRYDAIIFDPPTFGRGANGEMYKIERDLKKTLSLVRSLLSDSPLFVLFSSHTPGLSCTVAANILGQAFSGAQIETGEMLLEGRSLPCPSGIYCRALFQLPTVG
jgi:23S rRNA (cytosine1962-C5)-methyltransferase